MTTYVLCQNVTAVQSAPANGAIPTGSQSVNPSAGQVSINPQAQSFHIEVNGTGTVGATVQIMVSNDGGVDWIPYGAAIVCTPATNKALAASSGNQPWQMYTAYVTAISGIGASVYVSMGV
jgi:hypothetical protein